MCELVLGRLRDVTCWRSNTFWIRRRRARRRATGGDSQQADHPVDHVLAKYYMALSAPGCHCSQVAQIPQHLSQCVCASLVYIVVPKFPLQANKAEVCFKRLVQSGTNTVATEAALGSCTFHRHRAMRSMAQPLVRRPECGSSRVTSNSGSLVARSSEALFHRSCCCPIGVSGSGRKMMHFHRSSG